MARGAPGAAATADADEIDLLHAIELRFSRSHAKGVAPPRAKPLRAGLEDLRFALPQLRELIVTEDDYVRDLTLIIDCFLKPIRETNGVLSKEDEKAIFSNCETIRGVNAELLRLIVDTPSGRTLRGVAKAFQSMAPFLKAYGQYCGDFTKASSRLEEVRQIAGDGGSALEAVLQDGERQAGSSLPSLLIKPVQRLCKYPLLFRELLKAVPRSNAARAELVAADAKVEEVVQLVNDRVREIEGMADLKNLAAGLGLPELVAPTRYVAMSLEGTAQIESASSLGSAAAREHTLHICNDLVLLTRPQTGLFGGAAGARPRSGRADRRRLHGYDWDGRVRRTLERSLPAGASTGGAAALLSFLRSGDAGVAQGSVPGPAHAPAEGAGGALARASSSPPARLLFRAPPTGSRRRRCSSAPPRSRLTRRSPRSATCACVMPSCRRSSGGWRSFSKRRPRLARPRPSWRCCAEGGGRAKRPSPRVWAASSASAAARPTVAATSSLWRARATWRAWRKARRPVGDARSCRSSRSSSGRI